MSEERPKGGSGEHPAVLTLERRMGDLDRTNTELEDQAARMAEAVSDAPTPMPPLLTSDWTITIRGRGPHHNANTEDANRMAQRFVTDLREAGHDVTIATFHNGVEENVADGDPK